MKFENTEVWGFEHAIHGMRNPMNSHDKSDSHYENIEQYLLRASTDTNMTPKYIIGENDLKLMQTLIRAGSEHRKFLRQIFVSVDITAPLYYFKEFDTYKIGTTANSTSTMHKLASTPITIECFEIDDYDNNLVIAQYTDYECPLEIEVDNLAKIITNVLETLRQKYLETKDKKYWKELIIDIPTKS